MYDRRDAPSARWGQSRVQAPSSGFRGAPTVAGFGGGSSLRGVRATTSLTESTNAVPAAAAADSVSVQSSTTAAQPEAVAEQTEIPVLIVHGTFSNATEVEPLKENLESRGLTVYSTPTAGRSVSLDCWTRQPVVFKT